ncbi:MAG TPA: SCP2 sterol-binding domain-containing protein [Pseudonocardiaceae bacterium]|jgi:putative sterol carrier protein|nr:SCP2 sterol-binding domain-containing protein [Pseudonocardiaceae bacterium]
MTASGSATAFHEIKNGIAGRSDSEIKAYVAAREGGTDGVLDLVFRELPDAFLAEKAKQQEISFQYEINTEDGPRFYYADVRDGRCHSGQGKLPDPRVTMTMEIPVFLQVLTGTMAPVRAFLTRKIKVAGDMMAATKFESWFARP